MAPEQAGGHGKHVGPAADVYALGAILYECLTGRPPFKAATSFDTVLQVVSEEPVPPRRLLRNLPRDVNTITLKCLQKEPQSRYPSALALAEDLQRFLKGEPIRARSIGVWERGLKWVRRRPALAALYGVCAAVALGLLICTGAVFWLTPGPPPAEFLAQRGWTLLDSRETLRRGLLDWEVGGHDRRESELVSAIRIFDKAIKIEPRNGDLYNGRGYARVLLGQYREGVADAEEALRLGPRGDELRPQVALTFNAACIFAQAAGQAAADPSAADAPALAGRYRERALELLRKTVEQLPAPARAVYVRQAVDDAAFAPIRKSADFEKLTAEYAKPAPSRKASSSAFTATSRVVK